LLLLAKQVSKYDEAELCKLLVEISLLDSAYQRSTTSRDDVLMDSAKRYRVDTEKLQKTMAKKFAAKRDKKTIKSKARKTAAWLRKKEQRGKIVLPCRPKFLRRDKLFFQGRFAADSIFGQVILWTLI
jgi:hypothetical protein